jgi:lipopolysaccharide export system protein LptA
VSRGRPLGWAVAVLACCAPAASAQLGGTNLDCTVLDSRQLSGINLNSPFQVQFIGGPVIECAGGLRISADSAVMSEQTQIVEFLGHVEYADTAKLLTTDYAQYHQRDERLVAQGNVVLTDLQTGSVIRGPFLDYYQASETRPEELVALSSGRPRALLVRDSAGQQDTTIVDADGMEIHGQTRFVGTGNVEITRDSLKAYAQTAEFVQGGGTMRLIGAARIESDSLRMIGDSIHAETTADEELRELQAWGDSAVVDAEAVDVDAPWIRIFLVDGSVDRLIAAVPGAASPADVALAADTLPPAPEPIVADSLVVDSMAVDSMAVDSLAAGPPTEVALPLPAGPPGEFEGPRARAVSADFRLVGDSIEALAPGRVLERVVAVGHAFGERLVEDDSLSATLPALAQRDWLEGAVIRATFTDAPETAADSVDRVLESVTALGAPARSIYRRLDPDAPETGYSISYLLARRIRIALAEGEVQDVEAADAQGLYLQPRAAVDARAGTRPLVRR